MAEFPLTKSGSQFCYFSQETDQTGLWHLYPWCIHNFQVLTSMISLTFSTSNLSCHSNVVLPDCYMLCNNDHIWYHVSHTRLWQAFNLGLKGIWHSLHHDFRIEFCDVLFLISNFRLPSNNYGTFHSPWATVPFQDLGSSIWCLSVQKPEIKPKIPYMS